MTLQKSVMAFEMARSLATLRLGERDRLGERLRALIDEGLVISGAQHAANLARTMQARRAAEALFDGVDVLLATGANGLPVGLQLVGRFGEDHRLLAIARGVHARLLAGR